MVISRTRNEPKGCGLGYRGSEARILTLRRTDNFGANLTYEIGNRALSTVIKRPDREADNSSTTSVKVDV